MASKTPTYRLEYFKKGSFYRADEDYRRFVTLDYNLESYVGIIGVGITSGWTIESVDALDVQILPGTGIIEGYAVESPYSVKQRSNMVSGEREIEIIRYNSDPQKNLTDAQRAIYVSIIQEYDPSFNPVGPISNSYVKVVVPTSLTLYNDTDNYIYARRPSGATPYPKLDDYPWMTVEKPISRNYATYAQYLAALAVYKAQLKLVTDYDWRENSANHFTAVEFYVGLNFSISSSSVLLGKVTTRNGTVSTIDTSMVDNLENLNTTIKKQAQQVISGHTHGGSGAFDPPKIRLETDRRQCVYRSFDGTDKTTYNVLDSYQTSVDVGHKHTYMIDSDGNGVTIGVMGTNLVHFHKISLNVVGVQETGPYAIENHTHKLNFSSDTNWTVGSRFVVYINGQSIGDETSPDITVDPANKTLTISKIGRIYKTYFTTFTVPPVEGQPDTQNKTFSYTLSSSSLLHFMSQLEIKFEEEYGKYYVDTATDTLSDQHPFTFTDGSGGIVGFDPLKDQCAVGETLLTKVGDKFTFTPEAARNITVELLEVPSDAVRSVEIEILGNTEVTGQLRPESIAFIHADKVTLGTFSNIQIPFISHMGRFREEFLPIGYSLISSDGMQYDVSPGSSTISLGHYHTLELDRSGNGITTNTLIGEDVVYYADDNNGNSYLITHTHSCIENVIQETSTSGLTSWQNALTSANASSASHTHEIVMPVNGESNIVYSMAEDASGNLYAGTSSGLHVVTVKTPYVFVVNGRKIYLAGNYLWPLLLEAKAQYEKDTGLILDISTDVYASQVILAEAELIIPGTSYLLYGAVVPDKDQDLIMIKRLGSIRIPDFKYTALKSEENVLDTETVIGTEYVSVETGNIIDPATYDTFEDFEKAISDGKVLPYTMVQRYLDDVPMWSLVIKEANGTSSIVAAGANAVAMNENVVSDFYKDWATPTLPFFSGAIKKLVRDADDVLWIPTNGGILVSRIGDNWASFESTPLPGYTPNIKDIVFGEKGAIYCVSSDGIFKTLDGGKNWTLLKTISNGFVQIIRDFKVDVTTGYSGHYHNLVVNTDGNGFTGVSIGSGASHIHSVTQWTINSTLSHDHSIIVTLYAIGYGRDIYKSVDNGATWSREGVLPNGEISEVFVYNSLLFAGMSDGLYASSDNGKKWTKVIDEKCYSFAPYYNRNGFFVGTYNRIYQSNDGTTFTLFHLFGGHPLPSLYRNNSRQYFGYAYSCLGNRFYFKELLFSNDYIAAFVDFGSWMAERGGWDTNSSYDIFVDYKLVLSTKSGVDTRATSGEFTVNPDNGIIDMSASSNVSSQIDVYDDLINVGSSSGFVAGDTVYIETNLSADSIKPDTLSASNFNTYYSDLSAYESRLNAINAMRFFATVSGVSANTIRLTEKVDQTIELPATIYRLSPLESSSHIHGNIYDSPLKNVGTLTHEEIEDKLSYKSDYRPYSFNSVYLSNLLQLTQGLKFVYPTIDALFKKTKFYDFRYSTDSLDPYYVGNYIDLDTTASSNGEVFDSNFTRKKSFAVNDILIGRNAFDGKIIIATDIGIFWSKIESSFEANWFYIFDVPEAVYALSLFGTKLLAATINGLYATEDMKTWTLESDASISFPIYAMAYRWTDNVATEIPLHTATFSNDTTDPNKVVGVITTGSSLYTNILAFRGIKISNAGDKDGNYIVTEAGDNYIKTQAFTGTVPETINDVKIVMSVWWEQFDNELNVSNPNLTNTLLVGGKGMIAVNTNPSNYLWSNSSLPEDAGETTINGFCPLPTGTILSYGRGVNNRLLKSTDIGQTWKTVSTFAEIQGQTTKISITQYGHTALTVQYANPLIQLMDGDLDQLKIGIFEGGVLKTDGQIIWNEKNVNGDNIIYVHGSYVFDAIQNNQNYYFTVYPHHIISSISTPSGVDTFYGTDRGLYTDRGSLTEKYRIEGEAFSVGTNGTITMIDTEGYITHVEQDTESTNVKLLVSCLENVAGGSWVGKTLYLTDSSPVQSYTVLSNTTKNSRGETSVVIETTYSSKWTSYTGKRVVVVGSKSKVYINFDRVFNDGDFDGGRLYNMDDENNKSYLISKSTTSYMELDTALVPTSTYSGVTSSDLGVGTNIRMIDSSGYLEMFVTFFTDVEDGDLVGSEIVPLSTTDQNEAYSVVYNTGTTMKIAKTKTFESPLILSFERGDLFESHGFVMKSLGSFNAKKTSTEIDHYHTVNVLGNNVNGKIGSFYSNDQSFVTINVSDTQYFDSALLSTDSSLLKGIMIDFWSPENESLRYRVLVDNLDQINGRIKVQKQSSSYWDFSAYSPTKISVGWLWKIYSSRCGYTNSIIYNDFATIYQNIISDVPRNSIYVDIEDSSGILPNDRIQIVDENGAIIENKVEAIISPTRIQLENGVDGVFYFKNNPHLKVLRDSFTNNHVHTIRDNQIETVLVTDYLERGYPSQHSHRVLPYIASVNAIVKRDQDIILAGEGSIIFSSDDNGSSWKQLTDLNAAIEGGEEVDKVFSLEVYSGKLIAGTEKGYVFCESERSNSGVALRIPSII